MSRFLLDTNVISEQVRQRPDPIVRARYGASGGEMVMASGVWHELLYGLERLPSGRRRNFLAHFLFDVVRPAVPVLPFDDRAAEWLARERARLASMGRPRPVTDGMIAAVAATNGLTLVTRNTADFEGYRGLRIENWFARA